MSDQPSAPLDYARRHQSFGWWSLLVFATIGFALELLHGFKVRAYLDVSNETRRLMWTLAHAHGTLLSLVHVIAGVSLRSVAGVSLADRRLVWRLLVGASILLPTGFFLGGITFFGGDPGLGVLLVPVGAALLLGAIYNIARAANADDPIHTSSNRSTERRG